MEYCDFYFWLLALKITAGGGFNFQSGNINSLDISVT